MVPSPVGRDEASTAGTPAVKVKVLYVIGAQRGGTTIAGRLLGRLPGFAFAGEVRRLLQIGVREGRRCGCGLDYATCPVWSVVLAEVLGPVDQAAAQRWQDEAAPDRGTSWRSLRLLRHGPLDDAEQSFCQLMGRLYQSFRRATGAQVVVDTSKSPIDAALLTRMPDVDPYFLHVVRDPRGTVDSVVRRGSRPQASVHLSEAALAAARWSTRHLHAGLLRRRTPDRYLVVRYEDMVSDPNGFLAAAARHTGEPVPTDSLVVEGVFEAAAGHTPTGQGRFPPMSVHLVLDERWRSSLHVVDRVMVTTVSAPLAFRYGYVPPRPGPKAVSWPSPAAPGTGR